MATQLESLDELLDLLRRKGVAQVNMAGKVATTISPKGYEIAFRGRLVVTADLGGGEHAQYVEQVKPHVTRQEPPDVSPTAEHAAELRQAQLVLARQLRAYREEYQGLMDAARDALTQQLAAAGATVVEANL